MVCGVIAALQAAPCAEKFVHCVLLLFLASPPSHPTGYLPGIAMLVGCLLGHVYLLNA